MKKVIVCEDKKVETICHTEVDVQGGLVVFNNGEDWYKLGVEYDSQKVCGWRLMNDGWSYFGGTHDSVDDAVEWAEGGGYEIYSFVDLDEFIQFYQEETND